MNFHSDAARVCIFEIETGRTPRLWTRLSAFLLLFAVTTITAHAQTPVLTQQVAPTILRSLRLDPERLDSVRLEQIPVLPFVFSAEQN